VGVAWLTLITTGSRYLRHGSQPNTLYHNNGDGTFTDITERAGVAGIGPNGKKLWSVSAAWIDYDNDGRLDLFVSNYLD